MTTYSKGTRPSILHETPTRIRLRWNRLLAPDLKPDYLEAWFYNLPGVTKARVNPRGRSIAITYDGASQNRRGILTAFEKVPAQAFNKKEIAEPRRRLVDALFHGALATGLPLLPPVTQGIVATAMGTPAILKGLDTLINRGLKARVLDMVTISASLLRANFSTAAAISAMVVVGEYLRGMTEDRSNALLQSLTTTPVEQVWVERDGTECAIPFNEVAIGDIVICRSGELVAVDGEILHGKALVDKSSITGESVPSLVHPGDEIVSGCVVVEGRIKIIATETGESTSMARIAELMTRALNEQSRKEKKSERLADALAPITLILGTALYATTKDVERALSVLTIDFACAVKLPTPVVIKSSMYAAAKEGVLFKSGTALESLAEVDAIVFDKTGTLTHGDLSVTDVVLCASKSEEALLSLAASVEDRHGHPIGRGLLREAKKRNLSIPQASNVDLSIAHGVRGMVKGRLVRVGSRHYISDDCGIDCIAASKKAAQLRAAGKSLVYVAHGKTLHGVIALQDTLRPEAEEVLTALKKRGIKKTVMLTGDHGGTASTFMEQFSQIDVAKAELTPEEKAAVVQQLKKEGYTVAVVGDGVNDALAFANAHVGICMSHGTGLARDSAQIILEQNNLHGLLKARMISLRVDRILQNCFNAGVGVNVGLLVAAGAGLLGPTTAAALHNMNTFAILGTAAWRSAKRLPPE